MQQIFTVWDNGKKGQTPLDGINDALKRGAKVVSVATAGSHEFRVTQEAPQPLSVVTTPWVVVTAVLEGTEEQLGL